MLCCAAGFWSAGRTCGARSHLRNTLAADGHASKVVQELLGHSRIKITMDLYSHVLPGIQDNTMQSFNGLLTRKTLKK